MAKNRAIKKKIVFGVEVELASPLCISSGNDERTDNDLQRNYYGEVFVPGTSLAGAMRAYIENVNDLFGKEQIDAKEDGIMSPLSISDLYFEEKNPITNERDGVGLEDKTAKDNMKFDMEIIETGAIGTFRMCLTIREQENLQTEAQEEKWIHSIKQIFYGISKGEIRFGAKKNRGFGRFTIKHLYVKEFGKENVEEWLNYKQGENIIFTEENQADLAEWTSNGKNQYVKYTIPLILTGGISIRKYAVDTDANFEHVKCNGVSVVPGTSWAGAIRDRMRTILSELSVASKRADDFLKEWFGKVLVNNEKENSKELSECTAAQSKVVFWESQIDGGEDLILTRNKINRFDGSTVDGALYTEKSHFEGSTELHILIKKTEEEQNWLAFQGLLFLAIKDLLNGYLAVGGQTAVGRGIFSGSFSAMKREEDGKVEEMKNIDCKDYWNELKKFTEEGKQRV